MTQNRSFKDYVYNSFYNELGKRGDEPQVWVVLTEP